MLMTIQKPAAARPSMPPPRLVNTKGAAHLLSCSQSWVYGLVKRGRLRAYIYNEEGMLVPRSSTIADSTQRQGQGLYFYQHDIEQFLTQPRIPRGRRHGPQSRRP